MDIHLNYQQYFQVKRKYIQSTKRSHLPDRKPSFIGIQALATVTYCYPLGNFSGLFHKLH